MSAAAVIKQAEKAGIRLVLNGDNMPLKVYRPDARPGLGALELRKESGQHGGRPRG
jgi:hypothetical protein